DAVDHADDVDDAARGLVDLVHGPHHAADHLAALAGHLGGAAGELVGGTGVVGVVLHGGGELLHRRGGLLQRGGLLLGAAREVRVAGGDLPGGGVDGVAALADLADDLRELLDGAVGVGGQLAELAGQGFVGATAQL